MKRFVFGVGAQKAGTTWLHYYLSRQSFSDFGFRKEYHVFDAAQTPRMGFAGRARKRTIAQLQKATGDREEAFAVWRMNFILNPESYFDYFNSRFLRDDVRLTGDITPSYAMLEQEVFQTIDTEFAHRGVRVFPIFLMRDPVYRLQSMVRMSLRDRDAPATKAQEITRMERFLGRVGAVKRGQYPETIENLHAVFGRERVYLGLYETLFTDAAARAMSDFLGLDLGPPPVTEKKNVSKTDNALTEDEYRHFRQKLGPVYDGVADLTDLDIDKHWQFRP